MQLYDSRRITQGADQGPVDKFAFSCTWVIMFRYPKKWEELGRRSIL